MSLVWLRRTSAAAIGLVLIAGCHHASPAPAPATQGSAVDPNAARLARARADSIARADARRRDSLALANARADSIRRAADQARAIEAARAALLAAVHFDFDRSDIRQPDRPLLDRKATLLTLNRPVRLRVEGNTDERGSDEYNLALGMRRAAEIRRFLMTQGIDSSRMAITSSGEERPACGEHDEACWSRNRRAEFNIVAGAERIVAEQRRP